jgi:hypothetical protein
MLYTIGVERTVPIVRNSYEIRAQKFIGQIYDYIIGCTCIGDFEDAVDKFNDDYNRKVQFAHGLTRVCFITSDYVVKYTFGESKDLRQFGTNDSELAIYKEAERDNFAYLFAKPTPFTYREANFCIMPRVYGVERYDYDVNVFLSKKENAWLNDHVWDVHYKNYGWKHRCPVIFDFACRS